jgi:hypothetical protein
MTNTEKGRTPEARRKVRPVLTAEALRDLRIAFSAGIRMDVNTSGGPIKLDWEKITEVGKRGVPSSLPKPYGE